MEEPKIVYAPKDQDITISKWKVRDGARISSGSLILMYYEASGSAKDLKRLKATTFGIVSKRLFKEGDLVAKGSPLVELDECSHTTVIKDMCAECGQDLREDEVNIVNSKKCKCSTVLIISYQSHVLGQRSNRTSFCSDDTRRS